MPDTYEDILRRETVTTRVLDAACPIIFEAWTNPNTVQSASIQLQLPNGSVL
jgi:hypothetical protein